MRASPSSAIESYLFASRLFCPGTVRRLALEGSGAGLPVVHGWGNSLIPWAAALCRSTSGGRLAVHADNSSHDRPAFPERRAGDVYCL